jgi:hypothetical protein
MTMLYQADSIVTDGCDTGKADVPLNSLKQREIKNSSRKPMPRSVSEAVCQYIDYLTDENERQTQSDLCTFPYSDENSINLWHEEYYQEVMSRPIHIPTSKFSDWLRDVHNLELELNDRGRVMTRMTISPSAYYSRTQAVVGPLRQQPVFMTRTPHPSRVPPIRKRRLQQHQRTEHEPTSGFHLLIDAADQTVVREELVDGTSNGINDSSASGETFYQP